MGVEVVATPWRVPRLWEGRTVAILASGPSMSLAVANAVRAAGIPSIAINDTYRLAPWADMLYACDANWWRHHAEDALKFAGLKVTCDDDHVSFDAVLHLKQTGDSGFDPDPSCIRTGNNSGYQALHVAIHAGARRVLLCGFDMQGGHWFGSHPEGLTDAVPDVHRKFFIPEFETLAPMLPSLGVEVVNCTPNSALRCFQMGNLDDELRHAN